MSKLLLALWEVGSLLGPSWVLTFRGMSQLLLALWAVGPARPIGAHEDVSANLGTFASWILLGS